MQYNIAIVEDDPLQQERLLQLLGEDFREVVVAGVACDIEQAERLIIEKKPDLIFLDVMLPPFTGFDLLRKIGLRCEVIFTTSFEEYAVRAFRLSAVDYLIKPLVREELHEAMQKFKDRFAKKHLQENLSVLMNNIQNLTPRKQKIALPSLTGYTFVAIEEIVRCESDNTYTTFFLRDKRKIIISKTLKECENLLSEFSFFRVHNSNLINLEYIVEYEKGEGGVVKMIDGSHVDVSRRRKEDFIRHFTKIGIDKN